DNLTTHRIPCLSIALLFFFFQAEDGIRDLIVTGVQTCALPICAVFEIVEMDSRRPSRRPGRRPWGGGRARRTGSRRWWCSPLRRSEERRVGEEGVAGVVVGQVIEEVSMGGRGVVGCVDVNVIRS